MFRILALCCIIGVTLGRQPDAPHHSTDHLPNTAFSCRDKVLGGYYADPDAQCQMFHVCVKVAGVGIQDYRFLCPNGTAFDQEAQICAGWGDVACEPAALYYSSDNFDLYRIGSGFESKKAPHVSEEEQDFHLQRAEPDILSGAHSSNFFNNREGKDIDDPKPKQQNRNQVDQQTKRKVVKKLQRRPVETTIAYTTTTQRVFTNNFAGSFVPTTSRVPAQSTFASSSRTPVQSTYTSSSRAPSSSTFASSSQAQKYKPDNDFQKTNYYQQTKQTYETPKPTLAPVEIKKIDQGNYNDNRSFRQRPSPASEFTSESAYVNNNNRQNNNFNNNQNNYERSRQQNRRTQQNKQYTENGNNYSSTVRSGQVTERAHVNRGRGQQTYQNIRTSPKPTSYSETYNQQTEKQTQQYTNNGNNYNNKNNQQYNSQQSTQGLNNNYRNENEQQTTYKIKYASSTPQTTPQYNQQYDNNFKQFSQTSPENFEQYSKKPTPKLNEKKQQYSSQTKQTSPEFENYNKNHASSSFQQTPAPKFNTNLLYDNNNNQQSTPDYYSSQSNQQIKNNFNKAQNINNQFTSSVGTSDYSQYQQKSTTFEQQPTVQPSTYNPGKNNYYNQPSYDKSKLQQQYSTAKPAPSVTYNPKYEPRSSTINYKNSEYDDGQYRPEFYEREAGGQYDITSKQTTNKRVFEEQKEAPEQEFLKTAHSINIAASGNKLAKENRRLNAIAQTTSTKQQYYDSHNLQNNNYNSPSSTLATTKTHNENQFQNYHVAPTTTVKTPFNYENNQRNNYYSQSSTSAPLKIQYETRSTSQTSSSPVAPFNNQQYNARYNQRQNSQNYYNSNSTSPPVKQYSENRDVQKVNGFSQTTRQYSFDVTTPQSPNTQYTTASPRSVYSSFAAVTSEAPRPFSLRTESPSGQVQPKKHNASKAFASSSAKKPLDSKKSKDVSYDYAYYDTSDHYSDYENIEEFGRTSKKQ